MPDDALLAVLREHRLSRGQEDNEGARKVNCSCGWFCYERLQAWPKWLAHLDEETRKRRGGRES